MDENPYKAPDGGRGQADTPKSVWSQPVPWISFSVGLPCILAVRVLMAYVTPSLPSNVSMAIAAAAGVAIAALTCKDWPGRKPPAESG